MRSMVVRPESIKHMLIEQCPVSLISKRLGVSHDEISQVRRSLEREGAFVARGSNRRSSLKEMMRQKGVYAPHD